MKRYTVVDWAILGLVAVVTGVVFTFTWNVYYIGKALGGPVVARALSYGLWFIGAPLAASLIRKPASAFLGETLGALVETFLPNAGGFTNLIYGICQGIASEVAYAIFGYRKWGILQGMLAGAFAGPVAVALDAILFQSLATPPVMLAWTAASVISGAIYGAIVSAIGKTVRGGSEK